MKFTGNPSARRLADWNAQRWLHDAAVLAETHALSFYDASWAAAAAALDVPLVSAIADYWPADLAESPSAFATRLNLTV